MIGKRVDSAPQRVGWAPVAVLALAFAVRAAYAFSTADTSRFDEDHYCDLASHLLAGDGWTHSRSVYSTAIAGQPTSFFEPLYPALLAGIFAIVGTGELRWARVLQAALTTGSVALLMQLATMLWDRRIALITGLVAAVYIPFVFFSGLLMTENLFIFLLLLFLVAWTRAFDAASPARFVPAGIIFGAACLTRSALAGFLPIVGALTALALPHTRRGIAAAALFLVAALLTIAPWTARNYMVHHALVPITTKGGYNLYFYTYPATNLGFNERHAEVPRPDMHGLTEIARDRRFFEHALSNIRSAPALQLEFAAVKVFDFLNPLAKRGPWVLRYAHAGLFVVILGLALLGVRYARPSTLMTIHLLWSLVAFYLLLAAIFTGGGKARLPIEPVLLLLAGGGLALLWPSSASASETKGGRLSR